MNKNDDKIMLLKKQIEAKRNEIGTKLRFSPVTNCSLELEGDRYNLNVLQYGNLISLLIKLNTYKMSALQLELLDECIFSGYKVSDWMDDISAKLQIIKQQNEETKLKQLESKLTKMLSDDKKTELELEEIASLLK